MHSIRNISKTDEYPPIPYELLSNKHLLYDLIYNPSESRFLTYGKAKQAKNQERLRNVTEAGRRSLDHLEFVVKLTNSFRKSLNLCFDFFSKMTENTESTPKEENQQILQTSKNTVEVTIDYNKLSYKSLLKK